MDAEYEHVCEQREQYVDKIKPTRNTMQVVMGPGQRPPVKPVADSWCMDTHESP